MDEVLLVINSGSSSIKFSLFKNHSSLSLIYHGEIDSLSDRPCLTIFDVNHKEIVKNVILEKGHEAGLQSFFKWFNDNSGSMILKAVGHRVVHGGIYFVGPTIINEEVINTLESLNPLAPLHQPHNIEPIKIIKHLNPDLLQVACFDTTFHNTQERLTKIFAIPRSLTDDGIIRYGFHGISYEYIASVLDQYIGDVGGKRVIVAHLGSGASMCAIYKYKSVATSMGFSALDGLMMGTRCGGIDPGVLLYLMQQKNYSVEQLEKLLYSESGLLGVSGISSDIRKLLSSSDKNAKEAIELFCYRAALEVGFLSVALKGLDALVFTAGIGENSAYVRKKICEYLEWLGININEEYNNNNSTIISESDSSILVSVIPTNEEYMIAKHTQGFML